MGDIISVQNFTVRFFNVFFLFPFSFQFFIFLNVFSYLGYGFKYYLKEERKKVFCTNFLKYFPLFNLTYF